MARLPTVGGDSDVWATVLNEYLTVAHNSDGTLRPSGTAFALASSSSVGATTLTLTAPPPPGFASRASIVAIDIGGANCEIRAIASVTGSQLTLDRSLALAHSANVGVFWLPTGEVPFSAFGAIGDNVVTTDTLAVQRAIDEATAAGIWLCGNQARFIITEPIVFPQGARVRTVQKFRNSTATWTGPADPDNALAMSCQDPPIAFTANASTDTITTASNHSVGGAGNRLVFKGAALPGGITAGRVYASKSIPAANSLTIAELTHVVGVNALNSTTINVKDTSRFAASGTITILATNITYTGVTATSFTGCSAHPAYANPAVVIGPTLDITSAGSGGTMYGDVATIEKIYLEDVRFDGGNVAGLNGFMYGSQQPGEWKKVYIEHYLGTGLDILGAQIAYFDNLTINACGTGIKVSGTGIEFHNLNIVSPVDTGLHLQGCVGVHVFGGWLEATSGTNELVLFDASNNWGVLFDGTYVTSPFGGSIIRCASGSSSQYELRGLRVNSSSSADLVIDDLQRAYSLTVSEWTTNAITTFRQPLGVNHPTFEDYQARKVLKGIATLNFPSIAANTSAELTITVTGAAVGDTAHASPNTTIETGLSWSAYVSATNTVTVRVSNVTTGAIDPASRSWTTTVVNWS